ncbi:MAG: hypothetical protein ED557_04135 [Balneola sp.]|nr:MAG: hypothetical protein ED557_04135 [Balneola sp.]
MKRAAKMNQSQKFLMICLLVFGCTCTTTKPFEAELIRDGGKEEAIANAILDFSNTAKKYNDYEIFSINIKYLNNYDGLMLVLIRENYTYLLKTRESVPGNTKSRLPTRFIDKDDKLFFWWDDDYPLTAEALAVYEKYDILQDDENGMITLPDKDYEVKFSDTEVRYFFCKNDLTKYKKVVTDEGFINRPKLNCN